MPSLIGSAPNQVPTNGMLGTMAFQDADNVFEAKEAVTLTTGTGSAYILSPVNAPNGYYDGQTFNVKFHTPCGAAPTINVSGLGAKNLVYANSDGSFSNLSAADITPTAGNVFTATLRYNGAAFEVTTRRQAWSTEASSGTKTNCFITPLALRQGLNAFGTAPIYACRAWVNFNGTGTVAIRASGNVTSITDNGVGDYTVNFTTAMEDANYAVAGSAGNPAASIGVYFSGYTAGTPSTSSYRFVIVQGNTSGAVDVSHVALAVFR